MSNDTTDPGVGPQPGPSGPGPVPPVPPVPPPGQGIDGFFQAIRRMGVQRSQDRWVGGVAGGLATRFGVDPLLVRGVVGVTMLMGVGFVLYGIAWALLPEAQDGRIHLEETIRGRFDIALLGAIALVLIGTGSGDWWFAWGPFDSGWFPTLAWIAAVVAIVLILRNARRERRAGRPTWPHAEPRQPYPYPYPEGTPMTSPAAGGATAAPADAGAVPGAASYPAPTYSGAPAASAPSPAPTTAATAPGRSSSAPYAAGAATTPSGPYSSGPYASGPYASGPYASAPAATGPHAPGTSTSGPYTGNPYPGAPYTGGPYASGPRPPVPPAPPAHHGGSPVPPRPPKPRRVPPQGPGRAVTGLVVAVILLGIAGLLAADRAGAYHGPIGALVVGGGVLLTGLAIIVSGLRGRTAGGLTALAIVGFVLAGPATAWNDGRWWDEGHRIADGTRTVVTSRQAAEQGFSFGVGDATVDLSALDVPEGETWRVPISGGLGDVDVIVPEGTAIEADVTSGGGDITWLVDGGREQSSGIGHSRTFTSQEVVDGQQPQLRLDVELGLGSITIEED